MSYENYSSYPSGKELIILLWNLCTTNENIHELEAIFSTMLSKRMVKHITSHPQFPQEAKYALPEPLQELVNAAIWQYANYKVLRFEDTYKEFLSYFNEN